MTHHVMDLAQKIWKYHQLNNTLKKSDCILVLGSHDLRVAEWAATLYLQGWSPYIVFSGGLGNLTQGIWNETEADLFANVAKQMGVTEKDIIIENKSTNTGENILFTQKILAENNLNPTSFIVVQKPYMERRSFATFKKHWPEKEILVTSPKLSLTEYPTLDITLESVINIMVGDLQRIKTYPERGYQIYQDIPADVWQAYLELVQMRYTKHLTKD